MAFRASTVTINSSTPVNVYTAVAGDVEVFLRGTTIGANVYVCGPSGTQVFPVTYSSGLQVHVRPGDELWARSDGGTPSVAVLVRSA
jgi:hypothetical protein